MKICECIKDLVLEMCDDDGFTMHGEYGYTEKGSLWEVRDDDYKLIGAEVRLESLKENDLSFLEISREIFEEHFKVHSN